MTIEATAPSKLILSGEYAVLDGAPAVVAALDRRTRAAVEPADRWTLTTDLLEAPLPLDRGSGGVLRLEDGTPATQHPAARLLALATDGHEVGPLAVRLESEALRLGPDGPKLGLGSSAAVAVALHAALRRLRERAGHVEPVDGPARLEEALALHLALQDGRGSGVDVGASHEGGLVLFRRGEAGVETRRLPWPEGLHLGVVWTGEAVPTTAFLDALARARRDAPSRVAHAASALRAEAEAAAQAFQSTNIEAILTRLDAYREAMNGLGEAIGAEILSPPHRRLAVLARESGAVYKPSGAGGGDVGVLLADSARKLEGALDVVRSSGFVPVPATLDVQGVLVRET